MGTCGFRTRKSVRKREMWIKITRLVSTGEEKEPGGSRAASRLEGQQREMITRLQWGSAFLMS